MALTIKEYVVANDLMSRGGRASPSCSSGVQGPAVPMSTHSPPPQAGPREAVDQLPRAVRLLLLHQEKSSDAHSFPGGPTGRATGRPLLDPLLVWRGDSSDCPRRVLWSVSLPEAQGCGDHSVCTGLRSGGEQVGNHTMENFLEEETFVLSPEKKSRVRIYGGDFK